jgi:hypothetical protein
MFISCSIYIVIQDHTSETNKNRIILFYILQVSLHAGDSTWR